MSETPQSSDGRTVTISDINKAITTASIETGRPIHAERRSKPWLRHTIYVAKRRALEHSGASWQVEESLHPETPTRYDETHTAAIFVELIQMLGDERKKESMKQIGLTPNIISTAESLLFSDVFLRQASEEKNNFQAEETVEPDDARIPYPIRGHHFGEYINLVEGYAPSDIARVQRNHYETALKMGSYPEPVLHHMRDIIGKTAQDMQEYETKYRDVMREFKDLPQDYPVELVSGEQDKICTTTCGGEHCKLKTSLIRKMSMITHDRDVLSVFVNEARELDLADKIRIIKKQATFSDADGEEVEGIRTDKETFIKLLKDAPVDWREVFNVFPLKSYFENTTS